MADRRWSICLRWFALRLRTQKPLKFRRHRRCASATDWASLCSCIGAKFRSFAKLYCDSFETGIVGADQRFPSRLKFCGEKPLDTYNIKSSLTFFSIIQSIQLKASLIIFNLVGFIHHK